MGEEVEVRDNPSELRYELVVDGERAGTILYRRLPHALALVHTEVDPGHEGHGLGSRLVASALDDIRARALHVVPVCPFVQSYLAHHPEYTELVVADPAQPD